MKSQDILLLLKLVSLAHQDAEADQPSKLQKSIPPDWQDWTYKTSDEAVEQEGDGSDRYSMRALAASTGISKSEVSSALKRCVDVGLARLERKTNIPRANSKALNEFIAYGLKYVFPAKPGAITRGIATSYAAPVLAGKLMSAGEHIYVWADANGNTQGQVVFPLFKTVPDAVRKDPELYAMLALVDAIRLGNERETTIGKQLLEQHLRGTL